ncbi:Uncharacterised protein [Bordetella pertussis]|nr:Uncharacterised protein [Bordetella pertussis]
MRSRGAASVGGRPARARFGGGRSIGHGVILAGKARPRLH